MTDVWGSGSGAPSRRSQGGLGALPSLAIFTTVNENNTILEAYLLKNIFLIFSIIRND